MDTRLGMSSALSLSEERVRERCSACRRHHFLAFETEYSPLACASVAPLPAPPSAGADPSATLRAGSLVGQGEVRNRAGWREESECDGVANDASDLSPSPSPFRRGGPGGSERRNLEARAERALGKDPHPRRRRDLSRKGAGEANNRWRGTRRPNSTLTFILSLTGRGEDSERETRQMESGCG
jgi:hypothetical protein